MAIRIKSERIHQLAKTLAAMTGETQVTAIERALEEKLAEVRRPRGDHGGLHSGLSADTVIDRKLSYE